MDECGGVERLARLLLGELLRREFAELVVDQRQQLAGGERLAAVDRVKGPGDLVHRVPTPIESKGPGRNPRRAIRDGGGWPMSRIGTVQVHRWRGRMSHPRLV